ncbi:MAG TPA: hypothetical protein VMJ10_01090 [Kofleriaceae bacterium]|nr:hypothetical protein [Kofleriaceae bacterium]
MKLALVLVLVLGCARSHVTACADDLEGTWRDDAGERWMLLDHDGVIEGYPIFADSIGSDVRGAPRSLQLHREGDRLAGLVVRRYDHRADSCDARAPVTATCGDDALELQLGDPAAPASFAPCKLLPPPPPHAERWHRE